MTLPEAVPPQHLFAAVRPIDAVVDDYLALMDDSVVAVLPHALRIAVELGLAEALAVGPASLEALATKVGANAAPLYRLLRALIQAGFFVELSSRIFALTDRGERLLPYSKQSVRNSLLNAESCRAWLRGADSIRSGAPAFPGSQGDGFFEHKDGSVEANQAFVSRMRERAARLYPNAFHGVDWRSTAVVMDIGGGDTYAIGEILRLAPHLTGVLFDRPAVADLVTSSGHLLQFGDRCRIVGGDFFEGVPEGADTHLLCSVLHDWSDEQVLKILGNCRRALAPGGRVLIVEMLVPEDDANHPGVWSDVGMMVLTGGRERTAAEFRDLLIRAGYGSPEISEIGGSYFSLIQAC